MRKLPLIPVSLFVMTFAVSCSRNGEESHTLPGVQLPDTGYELQAPLHKAPFVFTKTGSSSPLPTPGGNLSAVPGVTIRPAESYQGCRILGDGRFDAWLPLASLLVFETPHDCPILDDASLPPGNYRLEGTVEKNEDIWPTIAGALEKSFAVRIRRTRRELNVWVLSASPGKAPKLTPTVEERGVRYASCLPEYWTCHGYTVAELTRELVEKCLHWIIVDETGLAGRYDFELPVHEDDPSTVISGIKQLGLQLRMEKRSIDVVVIESADTEPSAPTGATSRPAGDPFPKEQLSESFRTRPGSYRPSGLLPFVVCP